MIDYEQKTKIFKALSEQMRLKILDMLSCKELCACELLSGLSISQPTLSHHMKVLIECDLVKGRKDATWMYYSINMQTIKELKEFMDYLTNEKDSCICKTIETKCCK